MPRLFRDQRRVLEVFGDPRAGCGRPTQETVDDMDQLIKFRKEFTDFEEWAMKNNVNPKLMRKLEKGYEPAFDRLMSSELGNALTPENREAIAARVGEPERFQQFGDWDVEIQREP